MEKAGNTRSLHDHLHRVRSREQRWGDFKKSVALVRNSGLPLEEQETRIKRLESAHLGVDFSLPGNEYVSELANSMSSDLTNETPKPQKRPRHKRLKTIFRP